MKMTSLLTLSHIFNPVVMQNLGVDVCILSMLKETQALWIFKLVSEGRQPERGKTRRVQVQL